MIKISVILTTYNSSSFLHNTLQSILNQDGIGKLFELELIIIDDCSTDNTTEILRSLNLPFISTDTNSGGPNKGRNIGLKTASGDYICFIDHDDIWAKEKIAMQLKATGSATIVTSGFSVHYVHSDKICYIGENTGQIKLFKKNSTFKKILRGDKTGQTFYFSTLLIHSSLKTVFFEEEYGMLDYDHALRLFENQVTAEVCACLMKRFVYGSNLSLNENYRKINYDYSMKTISDYKIKYPYLVKKGIKRINGSMARYYYLVGKMKKARFYFRKSSFNLITILYYITSFGFSKIVKKYFRIFG